MPSLPEDSTASAPDSLREHDREVLEFLVRDPATSFGFQGLRRRLGLHQEKLSRALQRLRRDDLVDKTDLGYRISPHGLSLLAPTAIRPAARAFPLLQTFLPSDVDLRHVAGQLRGSWFGSLRWYGLTEGDEEVVMSWLTENGEVQIDARFRSGALSIDARLSDPEEIPFATRAAHELFRHIARAYDRRFGMNG